MLRMLSIGVLALDRLGCPEGKSTINQFGYTVNNIAPYTCKCGNYKVASVRVAESIIDKINDVNLQELPVFADPLYLSTELSLAMVVIVGKLGSWIAQLLYLPTVIGFLLAGMGIQVGALL